MLQVVHLGRAPLSRDKSVALPDDLGVKVRGQNRPLFREAPDVEVSAERRVCHVHVLRSASCACVKARTEISTVTLYELPPFRCVPWNTAPGCRQPRVLDRIRSCEMAAGRSGRCGSCQIVRSGASAGSCSARGVCDGLGCSSRSGVRPGSRFRDMSQGPKSPAPCGDPPWVSTGAGGSEFERRDVSTGSDEDTGGSLGRRGHGRRSELLDVRWENCMVS